jgi:general secretion pathway protein B
VSLILDALRKADSERERGSVPGLHAQPVPALSVEAPPPVQAMQWKWIAAGLAAGALGALGWYAFEHDTQTREVAAASAPTPALPAAVPLRSSAPPALAAEAPSPIDAQPIATPAPWPQPEVRKPEEPSDVKSKPAAEPQVLAREQLPDNVRSALPPLAVGGSIYSTNAANRSLVLDGRIYRERDQLTADLALEEIRPKAAVFRFKGYRFEIQF